MPVRLKKSVGRPLPDLHLLLFDLWQAEVFGIDSHLSGKPEMELWSFVKPLSGVDPRIPFWYGDQVGFVGHLPEHPVVFAA